MLVDRQEGAGHTRGVMESPASLPGQYYYEEQKGMREALVPNWYSGGFFVARILKREKYMSENLLPTEITTISSCLTSIFPGGWPTPSFDLDLIEQRKRLAELGISENRAGELVAWVGQHPQDQPEVWPYAFLSLETARMFCRTFYSQGSQVMLLGPSLRDDLVDMFLTKAAGYTSELVEAIRRKRVSISEGNIIGVDIIGDGFAEDHSYLCNGLEKDIYEKFGYRPNKRGLYDNYDDARQAAEWITKEEKGEPVLWLPWQVREYEW